ncbi:efflux RND transporter periplasmic adaptor subunit [Parasulfuritortus cantonensis]|uniref:Efflux RND transporter periplasmic adaptor subunit n=1 Tax=Parasulfuritortus cantonensis TaxID=2528202 RepID=A0A4V6NB33_9PROT|nr:efflux RND transporter periplasmic adaptor subunit [Parasulfuritortus cantonensis]TCJ18392.1 efflux RND transporter periplasmic adaptor subunit [Parasulfuritortus cantonensis]
MELKRLLRTPALRVLSTLALLALALFAGRALWHRYMDGPWTRDGRIRADVVAVAPDVAGLVTRVAVADNQFVQRGELLFRIDDTRFKEALAQAEALVAQRRADLDMRHRQASRRAQLDDQVVSREDREDAALSETAAQARLAEAVALRDTARTNLARTEVRAPVDGWVANLAVYAGEYAQAGQARLAVVDRNSFWVYGYFEENRLPGIHVGDPARMTLLGTDIVLQGHVASLARGITDRDNTTAGNLLANVNPNFTWVRLAQRIPVRIQIDRVPAGVQLASGMSCSIAVRPKPAS